MILRRALADVRTALSRQAAVALLDPRQVGKTTLALEWPESAGLSIWISSPAKTAKSSAIPASFCAGTRIDS